MVLGAGPYGRPELTGALAALGLRCNLSHTRGLAACAVTRSHTIGIDVELLRNSIDFLAIAQTHFTECECAQIAAAPTELTADVFFSIWTLKEAYLKAHNLPNEWDYFDPAKADEKRECGLHVAWGGKAVANVEPPL